MAGKAMQFKVTLEGIEPPIWRRFQIPEDRTFFDLHKAIQRAMGWEDEHAHVFQLADGQDGRFEVGTVCEDDVMFRCQILDECVVRLSQYFDGNDEQCVYIYDFGDNWKHEIMYEGTVVLEPGAKCPRCLEGERAGPPEDCGGAYRYSLLLEAMKAPEPDEQCRKLLKWAEGLDPECFSPEDVWSGIPRGEADS